MTSQLPPPPPRTTLARRRLNPWIWIGVGIALLGVVGAVGWVVAAIPAVNRSIDEMHRAAAGDSTEFVVEEVVEWDLFLEPRGASQSGLRFWVIDDLGAEVSLARSGGFSYEWGSDSGRAIASVRLEPGRYELVVEGNPSVVAIGSGPSGATRRLFVGVFVVAAPLLIAGIAISVTAAIRDTRRRTTEAAPPGPSPWSAGEWPADSGR